MNKELFAILKKGEIETDEDFNIFYKYSDDVITDTYSFEELTDVRIYIWEEKGIFCEIYADIDKDTWGMKIRFVILNPHSTSDFL